jgi:hypothetical protein
MTVTPPQSPAHKLAKVRKVSISPISQERGYNIEMNDPSHLAPHIYMHIHTYNIYIYIYRYNIEMNVTPRTSRLFTFELASIGLVCVRAVCMCVCCVLCVCFCVCLSARLLGLLVCARMHACVQSYLLMRTFNTHSLSHTHTQKIHTQTAELSSSQLLAAALQDEGSLNTKRLAGAKRRLAELTDSVTSPQSTLGTCLLHASYTPRTRLLHAFSTPLIP